ncbi:MAG: S9 family peptidase [Bacteroidales bacterium]|nr:S9 family peptidase [Bacteroidales bacterium]MBN2698217.1 S9 family peptidase [Bacteroidales bacterium]
MKKLILFFIFFALFSCVQSTRDVKQYSVEQFFNNLSVSGGSFSHDESRLLITSNKTGIYNVYAIDLETAEEIPLTFSDTESAFAISYFPGDNRFLFSADQGGNEITHIFLQDVDGKAVDLTPWEGARSGFGGWARNEKSFFFVSNKRDLRYMDLYRMDIETMQSEMIYENTDNLSPALISHDQKYLVLEKSLTSSNNELFLLNLESGELKHLSEHKGNATFAPTDFSLDNKTLYYLTNQDSEFRYLASYDLETGQKTKLYETNWDVMYANNSYNETYRVIGINEDARTMVKVFEIRTGKEVEMPEFRDGSVSGVSISKSEELIRLSVGSSTTPGNLFLYSFKTGDLNRLTETLNPEINREDLVEAEVIRFASFDGLEIPAILYKPHQASAREKVPALVWVHGGPGGQSRVGFSSLIQFFANHGYAVLAVNNRGSSGYGKTFYDLDNRRHGEDDLMDCVKSRDYLSSLNFIDDEKIGIIGGSYGGYMVMAALAFQPDAFKVGVDIFGVTNWLRTLKSIPPWWEADRKALYDEMGDPFTEDSLRLFNISPLFHASNVASPLMVLQGANDPRVLKIESDEIVKAVKANGVPVEYIVFDDEGHGFRKKENEIEGYGRILAFLDKYLKEKV